MTETGPIREIARLQIDEREIENFLAGYRQAVPVFMAAEGCRSVALEQCVEDPAVFHLIVVWDALEDHTVRFRNSPGFQTWRGLVGAFFSAPPDVRHFRIDSDLAAAT